MYIQLLVECERNKNVRTAVSQISNLMVLSGATQLACDELRKEETPVRLELFWKIYHEIP